MYTFIHMTSKSAKTSFTAADGTQYLAGEEQLFPEELTVPTTMAELAALDGGPMVEISVGSGKDAKTLKVPQVVRDYISGRKLRSNQEQQAENKTVDPAKLARDKTESWYGSESPANLQDIFKRMQAAKSPKAKKAYNDWLNGVYAANKATIDSL